MLARVVLLALVVLLGPGCAGRDHGGHHEHRFQDAERWTRVFDDPARDAWQRPDDVIQALALSPGALVAAVGSGTMRMNGSRMITPWPNRGALVALYAMVSISGDT